MKATVFKVCPACGHEWLTLKHFLNTPELRLIGYQPHFESLTDGLFIFAHTHEHCGTSLGIPVKDFIPLSKRPILSSRSKEPENCPLTCMRKGCFDSCPETCECTWVREVLHTIKMWPRETT